MSVSLSGCWILKKELKGIYEIKMQNVLFCKFLGVAHHDDKESNSQKVKHVQSVYSSTNNHT